MAGMEQKLQVEQIEAASTQQALSRLVPQFCPSHHEGHPARAAERRRSSNAAAMHMDLGLEAPAGSDADPGGSDVSENCEKNVSQSDEFISIFKT